MSNIIQLTDFKNGEFRIPKTSWQEETLQDYLDKYERHYLVRLFGVDLYALFIADLLNGEPTSQRFIDVFNEFVDQDDCEFCDSQGMKLMIQGFIYFHYVRHTFTRNTTNGVKQTKSENSISLETVSSDITTRYNNAVESFRCIQRKMCDEVEYPEYKGVKVEEILPI